jgi:hypothetical protein
MITPLVSYTMGTRHLVITPLISYTKGTHHLMITLLVSYTKVLNIHLDHIKYQQLN